MSITQTLVQERLRPVIPVARNAPNKVSKPMPSVLLRSSSFDRLKQFPSSLHAYLCRHGSAELFKWLNYSTTTLSSSLSQLLPQLHNVLLIASVYGAFCLASIQLAMCLGALLSVGLLLPKGLAFLLTCIFAMAALAIKLNLRPRVQQRTSRSRTRHPKAE